jgi:hypothetical protein
LYLSIRIRKEKEEFPKERENTEMEGVVGREKKLSRAIAIRRSGKLRGSTSWVR